MPLYSRKYAHPGSDRYRVWREQQERKARKALYLPPDIIISAEVDEVSGGILVSWSNVYNTAGYYLYYQVDGGDWQKANSDILTDTEYSFDPQQAGSYNFAVTAVFSGKESAMTTLTPSGLFTDVPDDEGIALMAFYEATGGDAWTDNTNWMVDSTVGNWFGVTVSGGHVTQLNLSGDANVSGTFSLADLPASMTQLILYNTSSTITGSLSDLPASMTRLILGSTSSTITGGATAVAATGMTFIITENCSEDQATVNDVIDRIYADRALFTYAAPSLDIGGNNAAPSGIYQYAATPSTALEKVYALENDDDLEGFNKWDIAYTLP
jgi:hypothetical protein